MRPVYGPQRPVSIDVERGVSPLISPLFGVDADRLAAAIRERDHRALVGWGGVDGLSKRLHTDGCAGLCTRSDNSTALWDASRREHFGENRFRYPAPKPFWRLCWEAWNDLILMVLTAAAVLSLVLGFSLPSEREQYGYLEGCAILAVVVFIVVLQASIHAQKERRFRSLSAVRDAYAVTVVRDGQPLAVPADQLLVGDVVKVSAGERVPADGVLLHGCDVRCDESAMTGESEEMPKTPLSEGTFGNTDQSSPASDAFLLSGTVVTGGVGYVLVLAVGARSQWGQILSTLITAPEDTALQVRLDRLARHIGYVGLVFAGLVLIVLLLRWIVSSARSGHWDGIQVLNMVVAALAILVVAIPEGLPLAVTLSLAFAMRQMMKDHNLVRRLEACEIMGSATQLNVDKTGTMTANRMTVMEAYLAGASLESSSSSSSSEAVSAAYRERLAVSVAVNSQAELHWRADGVVEYLGNRTECALLQWLQQRFGADYRALREQHVAGTVHGFDSTRKCMSSVERVEEREHHPKICRVYCKGAPEVLLSQCVSEMEAASGTVRPLSAASRDVYRQAVATYGERGWRTLLLAYREVPADADGWTAAALETQLTVLAVVGIEDPLRPETAAAVQLLRQAGVTVRMVTGDHVDTARRIARESGLLEGVAAEGEAAAVMEGAALRQLPPSELLQVVNRLRVVARATPQDKLLLVQAQRQLGEVVAVTGDGTNDAPALKAADVGFGMGICGTEVAKEASDIIILDDRLSSMAAAVLWGRNVYDSVRKFLQFQLSVNVVAVALDFVGACAGEAQLPLSAVPLLWVNMIMDSLGALALATEPPRPELMHRRPFGRYAPLVNRAMWRNVIGVSAYQLAVSLVLLFAGVALFDIPCSGRSDVASDAPCSGQALQRNGIIFNVFVFMQWFAEVNSRRVEERDVFSRLHRSPIFVAVLAFTAAMQVVLVEGVGRTAVGQSIGIVPLNWVQWLASVALGALVLPVGWAVRWWPLRWTPGRNDYQESTEERPLVEDIYRVPKSERHFVKASAGHIRPRPPRPFEAYAALSSPSVQRLRRLRVFVHATVALQRMQRASRGRSARSPQQEKAAAARYRARRRMRSRLWALIGVLRLERSVSYRAVTVTDEVEEIVERHSGSHGKHV
ncbi:hypothetical protein CDCA_CDCA05G1531 [Cyanidium caldarium]|uniref:Calcium-transporting ATPase n=1 Tax=Cyanidium caldarium TaxID=2771 RepID=A0AAV9ITK3_CYACA|nr:hypothetical protein CDCA_CDCA05G1531 [Cyanidium caldarium]